MLQGSKMFQDVQRSLGHDIWKLDVLSTVSSHVKPEAIQKCILPEDLDNFFTYNEPFAVFAVDSRLCRVQAF